MYVSYYFMKARHDDLLRAAAQDALAAQARRALGPRPPASLPRPGTLRRVLTGSRRTRHVPSPAAASPAVPSAGAAAR